jgi:integrase
MAKKAESQKVAGKLASYAAKYSNTGTGSNYKIAVESFLRTVYKVEKSTSPDYEALFEKYLADKSRNRSSDIKAWSEFLVRDSVSKQSARQRLTYGVKVLKAHGVTVNEEDVQDIKRECKGGAATVDKVMTHDVICKALRSADVQLRALILSLASSGLRVGELTQMVMTDFDFSMTPVMVTVRAEVAKNKQQRYTFLSQEAYDALKEYLKVREQFINGKEKRVENLNRAQGISATVNKGTDLLFPVEESTVNKKWEVILRKAALYSRDARSNRNQYRLHSLRKFFISQLSLAGHKTLAEHLAGHTGYLDQSYRQVSPEFAAREYLKLQSVLTCCIPESVKAGIKMADEKISILMEKTELQQDSVEGLKIMNSQLRSQMEAQMQAMQAQMAQMQEMIEAMAPYHGAAVATTLLKNKK